MWKDGWELWQIFLAQSLLQLSGLSQTGGLGSGEHPSPPRPHHCLPTVEERLCSLTPGDPKCCSGQQQGQVTFWAVVLSASPSLTMSMVNTGPGTVHPPQAENEHSPQDCTSRSVCFKSDYTLLAIPSTTSSFWGWMFKPRRHESLPI